LVQSDQLVDLALLGQRDTTVGLVDQELLELLVKLDIMEPLAKLVTMAHQDRKETQEYLDTMEPRDLKD